MININFNWEPPEIPDFDPEIHDPEKYLLSCVIVVFTMQNGFI